MMRARSRGWRFVLAESDEGAVTGPRISIGGGIEMIEGAEDVRQSISLLLRTRPGERVMRPEYGCDLHRLFFAPNDDTTAGLAIHYVKRALDLHEPRIDVLHLDANRHPDLPAALLIQLEYRLRSTQQTSALAFSLDLNGE
ncbi:MAG: GPW/gp25 family protein [Betaproteobacteria bacterium]